MKEKHERKFDDKLKCWMIWEPSLGCYVPDDIQTKSGKEEDETEEKPAVKFRTMMGLYNKEKEALNEQIGCLRGYVKEQRLYSGKCFLYDVVKKQQRLNRENVTEAWCRSKKLKTLKQIAIMGMMEKWDWSEDQCLKVLDDVSVAQVPIPEKKASDKTLTERGLNLLMIGENPKVKWILDCMAQAIYNKLIRDDKVSVKWSKDDLDTAITIGIKDGAYWFSFTDEDFRKLIGRKLAGWQIRELFLEAKRLELTLGKRKILWDGDKRHWRELLDFSAYLIQAYRVERERITTNRPDISEDHSSLFRYSFMLGFIFEAMISSNLSWAQYKLLPRRVYQCSLRAQEIYRFFKLFENKPKCRLTYDTLQSWKCMGGDKRVSNFLNRVVGYLAELEAADLLRVADVEGKGTTTAFILAKPLPSAEQKRERLSEKIQRQKQEIKLYRGSEK